MPNIPPNPNTKNELSTSIFLYTVYHAIELKNKI